MLRPLGSTDTPHDGVPPGGTGVLWIEPCAVIEESKQRTGAGPVCAIREIPELADTIRVQPRADEFTFAPSVRKASSLTHHLLHFWGVPQFVPNFSSARVRTGCFHSVVCTGRNGDGVRAARLADRDDVLA